MSTNRLSRRAFLTVPPIVGAMVLVACAAPPTATTTPQSAAATPPPAPASTATVAPTAAAAASAAPTAKPATGAPVTIRVNYRIGDKPEIYEKYWPKFMQENPDIKLVGEPISFGAYEEYFAKLASMMAADNLGDIVWVSAGSGPFLSEVYKGFFRPIDDLIAAAKFDFSVFYTNPIEGLKYEGKLYAMPSDFHPGNQIIFYNMNMFDAAGVKYPTNGWTYDDFNTMGAKLTKRTGDKTDVFGYGPNFQAPSYEILARSNGGSQISADGKKSAMKDDPARSAYQWLYEAMHKLKFATRKQDIAKGTEDMFYAEQVAMVTVGTGSVFTAPARIGGKFKFQAVRTPRGKGGKFGGMIHIGGQAMNAKTKYPEQAFRVLEMITNSENAQNRALEYGGYLPRKDLFESPVVKEKGGQPWAMVLEACNDPDLKPYFTPWNFRTSEMQSVIEQTSDALWTASKPFDAGLDDLDSALNIVLAKPR
jgi:multiple sugar transport system substrate-binding protein